MIDLAEIHRMVLYGLVEDRRDAAWLLKAIFPDVLDKDQAWQDFLSLIRDKDTGVRREAMDVLEAIFANVPEKVNAWNDLYNLAQDKDLDISLIATEALENVFAYMPDKTHAWHDLYSLAQNEYLLVGKNAAYALKTAFPQVKDKSKAWKDLIELSKDHDLGVRRIAASVLNFAFPYVPNKSAAWMNLIELTRELDSVVQRRAIEALGTAFNHMSDKEMAWEDLHWMVKDDDSVVRRSVAKAISFAYPHASNKAKVWEDLVNLTQDSVQDVRIYAFYSLGRISVLKAIEAEDRDTILRELETAITYFGASLREQSLHKPAKFCLPFYRSYLAITFEDADEKEVDRYLTKAKEAVGGSKSKAELFEAVESLSKALQGSQRLKTKTEEEIALELDAYRWYCDKAAEHMDAAEEGAPGVVELMKKCNPFLEKKIQAAIAEIQKKAEEVRQVTRGSGTKYEALGFEINETARSLSSRDTFKTIKCTSRITSILKEFCKLLPYDKRGHACEIIKEIEMEEEPSGRLNMIELALTYLQPNIEMAAYESASNKKLTEIYGEIKSIDSKMDNIIFDLSRIKIGSGYIANNLLAVRTALTRIIEIEQSAAQNSETGLKVSFELDERNQKLAQLVEAKAEELETILGEMPSREDVKEIMDKLESLKPRKNWEWLGRIADLVAIFDEVIKVVTYINSIKLQ